MADGTARSEGDRRTASPGRAGGRLMRALVAIGTLAVILGGGLITASLLPSCVDRTARQHPPFAVSRRPATSADGCGLLRADKQDNCPPRTASVTRDEPFEIPSTHPERGLSALHGTLSLPADDQQRYPAVVLLHGSGPSTRDGDSGGGLVVHHQPYKLYQQIAELLSGAGVAVLRYDKRSCLPCYPGYQLDVKAFRFSHFEDDAHDALSALARHPRVNGSALVLVGHSQGGQIAAFVAHRYEHVAAVITLGGQLNNLGDSLLGQLDAMSSLRLQQLDLLGWGAWQMSRRNYASCFDQLRRAFDPDEVCLGGGVTQQALFEQQERGSHTQEQLVTLPMPLLMLQGNLDRNISPIDFETMRNQLAARDADIQLLDKVGHSFVHDSDTPSPRLSAEAGRAMLTFLAAIEPAKR